MSHRNMNEPTPINSHIILDRENSQTDTKSRVAIHLTEGFPHPSSRYLKTFVQMESFVITATGSSQIGQTEESFRSTEIARDTYHKEIGKFVAHGFVPVQVWDLDATHEED